MKQAYFKDLENILNKNIDFVEKIHAISDTVKLLINAQRCYIFIHDPISKSFWSAYVEGVSYIEFPDDSGVISEVFHNNKTVMQNDVQSNDSMNEHSDYIIHSMLASPIKDAQGNIVGVMQLLNKLDNEKIFTDTDIIHIEEAILYIKEYISRFIK